MANYPTTASDLSATVALGSPSLNAGDTIEFIKYANDYTSGADFSGTDLLKVTLGVGFLGSFQSALGAPLKLTANRTSTGAFWNRSPAKRVDLISTASTGVIYTVHMAGLGQQWSATHKTAGGYWCSAGTTYIAGDVDCTTLHATKDAKVFVRKTTGGFTLVTVNVSGNAYVKIETDITTANVYGGILEFNELVVVPNAVNVFGGTLLVVDSGTISTLTAEHGGVLDFSKLQRDVTITNASIGPGVTIRYRRNGLQPTWTPTYTSTDPRIEYVDD